MFTHANLAIQLRPENTAMDTDFEFWIQTSPPRTEAPTVFL